MKAQYTAAEVKAKLYAVLDRVAHGDEYVVTVRGKPVAKIVPVDETQPTKNRPHFGALQHLYAQVGDVVSPLGVGEWTEPSER